jgi:type II secretory pathway component GspD/PulD (secretin)
LLPEEETRQLETDVLVQDGQGVVIGGLIQEKHSNVQKKVPCLGDLYLVGKLFQRRELLKSRSEIIVTLVPRVVDSGGTVHERDVLDAERSQLPIFHGSLQPVPRPEPVLPDAVYNPRRIGCGR